LGPLVAAIALAPIRLDCAAMPIAPAEMPCNISRRVKFMDFLYEQVEDAAAS
jgi:hypothetical protein